MAEGPRTDLRCPAFLGVQSCVDTVPISLSATCSHFSATSTRRRQDVPPGCACCDRFCPHGWGSPNAAAGQSLASGGDIRGKLLDQSGEPLGGATVAAINGATGLTRTSTSATDGTFLLMGLPVGSSSFRSAISRCAPIMCVSRPMAFRRAMLRESSYPSVF